MHCGYNLQTHSVHAIYNYWNNTFIQAYTSRHVQQLQQFLPISQLHAARTVKTIQFVIILSINIYGAWSLGNYRHYFLAASSWFRWETIAVSQNAGRSAILNLFQTRVFYAISVENIWQSHRKKHRLLIACYLKGIYRGFPNGSFCICNKILIYLFIFNHVSCLLLQCCIYNL